LPKKEKENSGGATYPKDKTRATFHVVIQKEKVLFTLEKRSEEF
jgi:hypothetical protein